MDTNSPRDELHAPLGLPGAASPSPPSGRLRRLGAIALGLVATVCAPLLWGRIPSTQPSAIAAIQTAPQPHTPETSAAPSSDSGDVTGTLPASATAREVENASGVKIVRGHNGAPPGGLILQVPDVFGVHLTPAPDKRLVEKTAYGLIPRKATDGASAAEVYARPVVVGGKLKPGAPRIAILVGGLGLSVDGTKDAIARLPGAVTLGFAPYGDNLAGEAAEARDAGHETILQAPMEPIDSSSGSPGPHTLLASATQADNLDSLHWLMSRFAGYVGVANYLGAKLTADAPAFSPILAEIASRGLIYVDDGTSPRSLASDIASRSGAQLIAADVVLDASPSLDKIDAALASLETLARKQGTAVGVATALPGSLDRIVRWSAGLEARGIALTPLSAMAIRGVPAEAQK